MTTVRDLIYSRIRSVAEQQRKSLMPLRDDLRLLDSGLDSLCIAIVVANLEDELGVDPFASGTSVPQTLGDLVRLYDNAVAGA